VTKSGYNLKSRYCLALNCLKEYLTSRNSKLHYRIDLENPPTPTSANSFLRLECPTVCWDSRLAFYFSQALDLQPFSGLEKCGQWVLWNVNFTSIHEFQNWLQMVEWNVFQDNDRMLRRVILQECLKVRRASRQNHFVCFASLSITSQSHISETSFSAKMFEACNNVGLEIIPTQAELLLFSHFRIQE